MEIWIYYKQRPNLFYSRLSEGNQYIPFHCIVIHYHNTTTIHYYIFLTTFFQKQLLWKLAERATRMQKRLLLLKAKMLRTPMWKLVLQVGPAKMEETFPKLLCIILFPFRLRSHLWGGREVHRSGVCYHGWWHYHSRGSYPTICGNGMHIFAVEP